MAPAERLTEAALAQELGVSRTPVREALGRLQADGLVVPMVRGVAVATLGSEEIEHIYELRTVLEGLAAAQTARRHAAGLIAPAVIRDIQDAAEEVERAVGEADAKRSARANLAFHRAFGRAPANPFLEDALHHVWDRIAVSTVSNLSDGVWAKAVISQHQEICRAIVDGDEDAARRAAEEHIRAAMRTYRAAHRPQGWLSAVGRGQACIRYVPGPRETRRERHRRGCPAPGPGVARDNRPTVGGPMDPAVLRSCERRARD